MIQGITYTDYLIRQAHSHWGNHDPLPLDLFADMNNAGLDVDALETEFYNTHEGEVIG